MSWKPGTSAARYKVSLPGYGRTEKSFSAERLAYTLLKAVSESESPKRFFSQSMLLKCAE